MEELTLTASYRRVENGWVQAQLAGLPMVLTVAPTLDEARVALVDALREYLRSYEEHPEPPASSYDEAQGHFGLRVSVEAVRQTASG